MIVFYCVIFIGILSIIVVDVVSNYLAEKKNPTKTYNSTNPFEDMTSEEIMTSLSIYKDKYKDFLGSNNIVLEDPNTNYQWINGTWKSNNIVLEDSNTNS